MTKYFMSINTKMNIFSQMSEIGILKTQTKNFGLVTYQWFSHLSAFSHKMVHVYTQPIIFPNHRILQTDFCSIFSDTGSSNFNESKQRSVKNLTLMAIDTRVLCLFETGHD